MPWVCGGIWFPCIDTLPHSSHGHLEASKPQLRAVTATVNPRPFVLRANPLCANSRLWAGGR